MEKERTAEDLEVERWRMKKLLKYLQNARGNGTSMISLILPPKDQISRAAKMLGRSFYLATSWRDKGTHEEGMLYHFSFLLLSSLFLVLYYGIILCVF